MHHIEVIQVSDVSEGHIYPNLGFCIYMKWFYLEVTWNELTYGEVLGDKSAMYIRVNLYWAYLIVLWLFHLDVSCTVFVLTCFVMCGCVCLGFLTCGCVYLWVLWSVGVLVICVLLFNVFCIVCTVFFVLFRLCILIFSYFVCTSVRSIATEWQLNCS